MTQNKAFKRAVRAEKAASDTPYVVARRTVATGETPASGPGPEITPNRAGRVITVASSAAGTSKATMALLLAGTIATGSQAAVTAGLTERALKVVVVDLCLRVGPIASLIGWYVPTALNVRVVENWNTETVQANLVHDKRLGVDALLAPITTEGEDFGPQFYRDALTTLRNTHDVIVINAPDHDLDPLWQEVAFAEADQVLFETLLDTISVQQMARLMRSMITHPDHGGLGLDRAKVSVVINESTPDVGMERDHIEQVSDGIPVLAEIPATGMDVNRAVNYGRVHTLIKHAALGPAYFRLAKTCVPGAALTPVHDAA